LRELENESARPDTRISGLIFRFSSSHYGATRRSEPACIGEICVIGGSWLGALGTPRQAAPMEFTGMIQSIAYLAHDLGAIGQIDKLARGPREGRLSDPQIEHRLTQIIRGRLLARVASRRAASKDPQK